MKFYWFISIVFVVAMILQAQARIHKREADGSDSKSDETDFNQRGSDDPLVRGFGCNGPTDHDPYKCNRHCRGNGFSGGYCNALLAWFRCDCYK